MSGPLAGIRVIDFGRFIAGPYCAMLLADMGADVIRVERREGGEDRCVGPISSTGEGGLFLGMNRNKRGITLDPGHPLGARVVRRLVETADIVIVNLPLEVMTRLRLDYESLRSIKEDIILVMASAFGPDGPYRDRVGFDGVAQAMSGAMSLTGFPGAPVRSIVSFMDYGTALHGALGAMLALYERQKTGRGQVVDVSLLATGITFMQSLMAERAVTGIIREQQGNTAFYAAPSDVYQTLNGWIIVPTIGGPMFKRWARLVGREDLIGAPGFQDDISRAANHEVINEAMTGWCRELTREQAISELEGARIPCGPVYRLAEVMADQQVQARGLLENMNFPGCETPVPVASTPMRLSLTPGGIRRRAPTLGEHTAEILLELGFKETEIDEARHAGAI
jgi:crotonobetainyl-CoA:carnitine CoA-transferase CaiB-like acyl-CoA transferase